MVRVAWMVLTSIRSRWLSLAGRCMFELTATMEHHQTLAVTGRPGECTACRGRVSSEVSSNRQLDQLSARIRSRLCNRPPGEARAWCRTRVAHARLAENQRSPPPSHGPLQQLCQAPALDRAVQQNLHPGKHRDPALRLAVLPPVLGPVMTTARVPALTNTSIATMRFLAGTCSPACLGQSRLGRPGWGQAAAQELHLL